jgi:hypothetical protein
MNIRGAFKIIYDGKQSLEKNWTSLGIKGMLTDTRRTFIETWGHVYL